MKKKIVNNPEAKEPTGSKRSAHWSTARKHFLAIPENQVCAMCGGSEKLEVHHVRPFHLHPELELDPNNLITLCEAGHDGSNCHLLFGHLGNFKSFNVDVREDAKRMGEKIENRPMHEEDADKKAA